MAPKDHDRADTQTYLHRIGRTGRFGRVGVSISLMVGPRDHRILTEIQDYFGVEMQGLDPNDWDTVEEKIKAVLKSTRAQADFRPEVKDVDIDDAAGESTRLGFPVMLKATAGGGGMGLATCGNAEAGSSILGCSYMALYNVESHGGYQLMGLTIPGVDILGSKPGDSLDRPWLFEDFDQLTFHEVQEEEYGRQLALFNSGRTLPLLSRTMASATSIYDFKPLDKKGQPFDLSTLRNKVILIVNTASKCGFTPQYAGLETLYKKITAAHPDSFVILGFPCNQFMQQDPGDNDTIQNFCQVNYGVSFPILGKTEVNGENAEPVFEYLKKEAPGLFGLKR
ncbi:MAG: hypothetical protein Q9211_004803, partial [Gyalolechia sp. 1 TL-2023]